MTIQEAIGEISMLINTGSLEDDSVLDDRLILQWLVTQRALFLKNELNKGRSIEDEIRQTINGIPMVIIDKSTFPFVDSGTKILRSEKQIPVTIDQTTNNTILQVRNSDFFSEKYNYVHRDKLQYVGHGKFNKNKIFCTIYNNYLYIPILNNNSKTSLITHVSIEGVFEDFTQAISYNNKIESVYGLYEYIFPISLGMWDYIKSAVLQLTKPIFNKSSVITNDERADTNK